MEKTNHKRQILAYLKEHGSITPMEALSKFGCYRLGARIWDLRQEGVKITTDIVETMSRPGLLRRIMGGKSELVRYARYRLSK